MKLKNETVFNAKESILKLKGSSLPIRILVKVNKTASAIIDQYNFIEGCREELVRKYGEHREDGFYVDKNDTEKINKFYEEFKELLDCEEEIDVRKVSVEDLPETVELNGYDLDALSFMFE